MSMLRNCCTKEHISVGLAQVSFSYKNSSTLKKSQFQQQININWYFLLHNLHVYQDLYATVLAAVIYYCCCYTDEYCTFTSCQWQYSSMQENNNGSLKLAKIIQLIAFLASNWSKKDVIVYMEIISMIHFKIYFYNYMDLFKVACGRSLRIGYETTSTFYVYVWITVAILMNFGRGLYTVSAKMNSQWSRLVISLILVCPPQLQQRTNKKYTYPHTKLDLHMQLNSTCKQFWWGNTIINS